VTEGERAGEDPRFDLTNAAYRLLCTLSFDLADLSPQLFGYFELHRSRWGVSLTRPLGGAVVGYAEWAGGLQADLGARALQDGRLTGAFPPSDLALPHQGSRPHFQSDAAAGASFTLFTSLTLNAEYHFHESGFTRRDWSDWFALGAAKPSSPAGPAVASELWYIRGYAAEQQEPMSRHQLFVRAAIPRVFVREVELSGFAMTSLLDGSTSAQVGVSYFGSDHWTLSTYASANLGSRTTEHGSLPYFGSFVVALVGYP
jgi:hypothetical protein